MMHEVARRFWSAVILGFIAAMAVYLGGVAFAVFCAVIGGVMIWEITRLTNAAITPFRALSLAWVAALVTLGTTQMNTHIGLTTSLIALSLLLVVVFVGGQRRWVCLAFSLSNLLAVQGLFSVRENLGMLITLWLIMTVVATDMGGFVFGRIFGGPKLLVKISPQKTWSGAVGGWMGAVGVSWLFQSFDVKVFLLTGIAVSVMAQCGDLAESWLKRTAQVKDSSSLLPGHGGFLDRFDGMVGGVLIFLLIDHFIH